MKAVYKYFIKQLFFFLYGKIKKKHIEDIKNIKIFKTNISKSFFYKIYEINNARVFTDCVTNVAYITENILIPKISYQQNNDLISNINYNSTLKSGTPKFKKKFSGNVFSLIQGASGNNYFHWLFDILPKIYILEKKNLLKKINYFYVPATNNYVFETLKEFGINKKQIIDSRIFKHIQANKVYAIEHLYFKCGNFHKQFKKIPKWVIFFLKKKFIKKKNKSKFQKKVYIDRSDSKFSHFQISNNKKIIDILNKIGFKAYKLSSMSFNKQVDLFNNASSIIGLHGAGFANIVFCKSRTKIFEILTYHEKKRDSIKTICKHAKLNHKKIIVKNKMFDAYNLRLQHEDIDCIKNLI